MMFFLRNFFSFAGSLPSISLLVAFSASWVSSNFWKATSWSLRRLVSPLFCDLHLLCVLFVAEVLEDIVDLLEFGLVEHLEDREPCGRL